MRHHFERNKLLLPTLLLLLCCLAFIIPAALADVEQPDAARLGTGLQQTAEQAGIQSERDIPQIVGGIVNALIGLSGAFFLVYLVYAGFLWTTARGGKEQVDKAKQMIIQSVIGLLIIFSAYAITDYVLTQFMFSQGGPTDAMTGDQPNTDLKGTVGD